MGARAPSSRSRTRSLGASHQKAARLRGRRGHRAKPPRARRWARSWGRRAGAFGLHYGRALPQGISAGRFGGSGCARSESGGIKGEQQQQQQIRCCGGDFKKFTLGGCEGMARQCLIAVPRSCPQSCWKTSPKAASASTAAPSRPHCGGGTAPGITCATPAGSTPK